jgi:hypothetical protein
MNRRYFVLRKQIFYQEIKHWVQQVQDLIIGFAIILGTAIPALLFSALLAFGIILDNDSPPDQLYLLAWSILVAQSLVLLLCRQAILGARYSPYLRSLETSNTARWQADVFFALLANPFVLMLIFIMVNIDIADWSRVPHGFLFLGLMLSCTMLSLYRPGQLYWFYAFMLAALPLLTMLPLWQGLSVCLLLLVATLLISAAVNTRALFINVWKGALSLLPSSLLGSWQVFCQIWLQATVGNKQDTSSSESTHANGIVLVCVTCILILVLTHYCALRLPEFENGVYFIGLGVIVLFCASLQLTVNKAIKQHTLFFEQFMWQPKMQLSQYCISAAALFVFIGGASIVFAKPLLLIQLVAGAISVYVAKKQASLFIVGWLLGIAISGALYFYIF